MGGFATYACAGTLAAVPLSTASSSTSLSPDWLDASAASSVGEVLIRLDFCQWRIGSADEFQLTPGPHFHPHCHLT